jgi:hypothetical protein
VYDVNKTLFGRLRKWEYSNKLYPSIRMYSEDSNWIEVARDFMSFYISGVEYCQVIQFINLTELVTCYKGIQFCFGYLKVFFFSFIRKFLMLNHCCFQ